MKNKFNIMLIACVVSVVISGCTSKKNPAINHIPANAAMVVSMDIDRLSEKSDFNSIKDNFIFKMLGMMLTQKNIPDFIQDRSVTGIDFKQEIYAAILNDKEESTNVLLLIPLKDEDKLIELLEKVDDEIKFVDQDGIRMAAKDKVLVGVKDKLAIALIAEDLDTEDGYASLKSSFDLQPEDELEAGSDGFRAFMDQKNDVGLWINMAGINWDKLKKHSKMPFNPAETFNMNLQVSLNFEDGYIHAHTESFANDSSLYWMKNMMKNDFDESLYGYLSNPAPLAVARMSLNPEVLYELLNRLTVLDSMEAHSGMSKENLKNIFGAFTGDILFSFDGFIANSETGPDSDKPALLLAMGIKDSGGFLQNIKKNLTVSFMAGNDSAKSNHLMDSVYRMMVLQPNAWIMVSNPDRKASMESDGFHPEGHLDLEIKEEFKDNQGAVLVDFQALQKVLSAIPNENDSQKWLDALKALDRLVIYQNQDGDFHNSGDLYLYLMDKNGNSLNSLIQTALGAAGGSLFGN